MNSFLKILTGILGVLAVIACLATIGIIGYSMAGGGSVSRQEASLPETDGAAAEEPPFAGGEPVPTVLPEGEGQKEPEKLEGHVHDYEETVEEKATCYQPGKVKYACECGDSYYTETASTGHVPDDWETVRKPSQDREGLKVKKCIYCDEIIAQETIPYKDPENEKDPAHVHQYAVTVEREPTCVLAGLRKHTCSCGSFYTETISAMGHIATDWTTAEEATESAEGYQQRTCTECGQVLDSRRIERLTPSPTQTPTPSPTSTPTRSPDGSASPKPTESPTPTPTATPSPTPTATPHTHNYTSYVIKTPNCQEKGMRSFVCSCGSSYAEPIDKDPNAHSFEAVITKPTEDKQGFTTYTCKRCGYSYVDNYVPATGA